VARLVAVACSTPARTLAALDAVWADGDAALPLAADLPAVTRAGLLRRLRPHALVDDTDRHTLPDAVGLPDGSALVATTSGSTGTPSGVVLGHDALAAMVAASRDRLAAADGMPWVLALPLHHVAGISVVLRSRAAGREPLLHGRDDPDLLAGAEPSWVSLVPTQLQRLLDAGADLARHAGVLLGGAAAPDALLARARDAGTTVVTSYGSSETCGGCVYDGEPLDGVGLRVDAHGRIRLRGPVLASGRRLPDGEVAPLVDAEGWYATGDRGTWDDDGRLVVLGRLDRVVVSGGENVPAGAVEEALASLPEVARGAVVGLPDARWGSAVTAVVVPAPGATPTLEGLRAGLRTLLPGPWLPTRVVVVDALPRDELGKVTPAAVAAAGVTEPTGTSHRT